MSKYTVRLEGCDDSTSMSVDLTDDELAVVQKLCELSEVTSTYGCMPTMSVRPYVEESDDE